VLGGVGGGEGGEGGEGGDGGEGDPPHDGAEALESKLPVHTAQLLADWWHQPVPSSPQSPQLAPNLQQPPLVGGVGVGGVGGVGAEVGVGAGLGVGSGLGLDPFLEMEMSAQFTKMLFSQSKY